MPFLHLIQLRVVRQLCVFMQLFFTRKKDDKHICTFLMQKKKNIVQSLLTSVTCPFIRQNELTVCQSYDKCYQGTDGSHGSEIKKEVHIVTQNLVWHENNQNCLFAGGCVQINRLRQT